MGGPSPSTGFACRHGARSVKFKTLDASFMTHLHQDHCDIYTIKATLATTACKYIGPKSTIEKTRRFQVPTTGW